MIILFLKKVLFGIFQMVLDKNIQLTENVAVSSPLWKTGLCGLIHAAWPQGILM